ncbi:MAG TPA: DUF1802 family protein, partial [Nitrososphaera sp.]|nr:DUF1802 family protein [Nitrososphaera sp.]
EGRQTVLLRKGGILEFRQGFEVKKHEKFMLFPTYEHQAKEHLQQDYAGKLDDVLREQPPAGTNLLTSYAEARLVREVSNPSVLKKLEKYHIWNESYVNARMAYNPKKPMSVILVRVHNLPTSSQIKINTKEEWAGCKSWIPVELEATAGGRPAVDDATFDSVTKEVMEVLQ